MARQFTATSSQYLDNSSFLDMSGACTLAGWFYMDSGSVFQVLLKGYDSGQVNSRSKTWQISSADRLAFSVLTDGTNNTRFSDALSLTTWLHLVTTWDGTITDATTIKHYLNGTEMGYASPTNGSGTESTSVEAVIGSRIHATDRYWNGRMAEMAMWSGVLSQSQISSLAAGYAPSMIGAASLLFYYPFIGRLSPEIDLVGGYDMTLNAGPTTAAHPAVIYPGAQSIMVPQASSPIGQKFILPPYRPIIS